MNNHQHTLTRSLDHVERDIEDHVLLSAHHRAPAQLDQDVARVQPVDLRSPLGVAQEG